MKKILGVVGSPRRKGNTHILVSKILEGAGQAGARTELLFLHGLTIRECDGCHTCWKGKPCSKRDDMNALYPRIAESDVIIFGTPVYWFGPTALMKGFLDRFVYFNSPKNRDSIKGKAAVLAAPFEDTDLDTASPLVALFEKSLDYLGMNLVEIILAPGVGKKGEMLKKKGYLKKALAVGKRLAEAE